MPPQDVWKFPPVFYRTSALWGCCPALTPPLYWITPSRASGIADHILPLGDWLLFQRVEISPCALQDISPLGPLPCSHSTTSLDHSKQGIGYR